MKILGEAYLGNVPKGIQKLAGHDKIAIIAFGRQIAKAMSSGDTAKAQKMYNQYAAYNLTKATTVPKPTTIQNKYDDIISKRLASGVDPQRAMELSNNYRKLNNPITIPNDTVRANLSANQALELDPRIYRRFEIESAARRIYHQHAMLVSTDLCARWNPQNCSSGLRR